MTHPRADVWWRCACIVSTIGVLCAYAQWGWDGVVMSAATVVTIAGSIGASVWAENGLTTARVVTRTIAAGGWFLTAATGLVAALQAVGVCLVVLLAALLALSSPGLGAAVHREHCRRSLPDNDADPVTEPDPAHHPGAVEALDDEALCREWRRTFLVADDAGTPADSIALVDHRARILDELHRRSPEGLAKWWVSGGPASGSPLPYLGGRRGGGAPGTG